MYPGSIRQMRADDTFPEGTALGPDLVLERRAAGLDDLELWEATLTEATGAQSAVTAKLPGRGARADAEARLRREAGLWVMLNHPRLLTPVGLQQAEGLAVLVGEGLDGPSLASVKAESDKRRQRWPANAVLELVFQAAEGLVHVERAASLSGTWLNAAHRALTHERIRFNAQGRVVLADFAQCWTELDLGPAMAPPSDPVEARYRAPELWDEPEGGRWADLWSLGVIAWELLTNRPFSNGLTPEAVRADVESRTAETDVRNVASGLDLTVALLDQLLSRDPVRRHLDPSQLMRLCAAALEQTPPGAGLDRVVGLLGKFTPATSAPVLKVDPGSTEGAAPARPVTENWSVMTTGGDAPSGKTEDWSAIPLTGVTGADGRPQTTDWSAIPMDDD